MPRVAVALKSKKTEAKTKQKKEKEYLLSKGIQFKIILEELEYT